MERLFLSTPPSRVATQVFRRFFFSLPVSIHATLAGGDICVRIDARRRDRFLSTPPSRVATTKSHAISAFEEVSIHATLAGGDRNHIIPMVAFKLFLSTPPSRVATSYFRCRRRLFQFLSTPPSRVATSIFPSQMPTQQVSIHATLAGGDGLPTTEPLTGFMFLSTPPSRVATL